MKTTWLAAFILLFSVTPCMAAESVRQLDMATLSKQATQGNAAAEAELGLDYLVGDGVPEDGKQAVFWYDQAANQGNQKGEMGLCLMYSKGFGVPYSFMAAQAWCLKTIQNNADPKLTERAQDLLETDMRESQREADQAQTQSQSAQAQSNLDAQTLRNEAAQDAMVQAQQNMADEASQANFDAGMRDLEATDRFNEMQDLNAIQSEYPPQPEPQNTHCQFNSIMNTMDCTSD